MIMRTWKGTSFLWQSKITLDGASHARKNLSNRQVNARNCMNTWQTIRRLNRLFCGRRILSTNAKPPSGDFTMPVLCSLLYVYERLKMHLPSMFRRKMSHNTYYSLQNSQGHIELHRGVCTHQHCTELHQLCLEFASVPIEDEDGMLKDDWKT